MEAVPARVAEGGGDGRVYNPVYGQGEDHPKPIADRPGIILRHPVDITPEQRRRERRERAQAIREALQRRAAKTRGLAPPTGSPQPNPDGVYAEIAPDDVYCRPYSTDTRGDEYYIYIRELLTAASPTTSYPLVTRVRMQTRTKRVSSMTLRIRGSGVTIQQALSLLLLPVQGVCGLGVTIQQALSLLLPPVQGATSHPSLTPVALETQTKTAPSTM